MDIVSNWIRNNENSDVTGLESDTLCIPRPFGEIYPEEDKKKIRMPYNMVGKCSSVNSVNKLKVTIIRPS